MAPRWFCEIKVSILNCVLLPVQLTGSLQHKEKYMTQLQLELSDHTQDIKQYLTAISDPRGGKQCSLSDMVYREG